MLKVKDWLLAKNNVKFKIEVESGPLVKDGLQILPKRIVVAIRLSDGARFTETSSVKVGGKPYRIREFYYDLKTVRLMWDSDHITCNINELHY